MMNITPTVKQLLIINIIVYIGAQLIPNSMELFGLYFFGNPNFRFWQPLTHMFMHAPFNSGEGIAHIAFNMLALYSFGSYLEHFWGSTKFIFFYLSCGLGAALVHTGVNWMLFHNGLQALTDAGVSRESVMAVLDSGRYNPAWAQVLGEDGLLSFAGSFFSPAVGASGAIYGLLVAFAFMFPDAKMVFLFIPYPVKAKYLVPVLILFDLFSGISGYGFLGSNVAHFAHLGGAVFGFIIMWVWRHNKFGGTKRWN
jgi:membrane associated rhomboid family serine protease